MEMYRVRRSRGGTCFAIERRLNFDPGRRNVEGEQGWRNVMMTSLNLSMDEQFHIACHTVDMLNASYQKTLDEVST